MEFWIPSEHLHRQFVLVLYFQLVYTATEYKRPRRKELVRSHVLGPHPL